MGSRTPVELQSIRWHRCCNQRMSHVAAMCCVALNCSEFTKRRRWWLVLAQIPPCFNKHAAADPATRMTGQNRHQTTSSSQHSTSAHRDLWRRPQPAPAPSASTWALSRTAPHGQLGTSTEWPLTIRPVPS